jgi:DNA-binding LacI/PurR family transcriptional regulator
MPTQPATRATIEDVARQAGVSAMTVSRVINKTGPVASGTAERIYSAITALNYIPHRGARALAAQKTNTIGLIFPEITDVFFFELIRGIQLRVAEHGYALLLYSNGRPEEIDILNLPLGEHNTDGLIVFTDSLGDEALARLHARGFPLVLLHRSSPAGLDIPSVAFQNQNGAYQMAEHLIRCGHRRIAFLAGAPGNEDSARREAGYRQALAAHNLPVDPALIGLGGFDDLVAATAVSQWLRDGIQMDAIFAGDDVSARGAIQAIQQAGRRVPEDIAVVGFDDALLSQHLDPPLTTVRAPIEEAGRVAADQLICLIHTGEAERLTLLPTELIIRRSCGWWLVES